MAGLPCRLRNNSGADPGRFVNRERPSVRVDDPDDQSSRYTRASHGLRANASTDSTGTA